MKIEFDWRDYDNYAKWLHDALTTLYEENEQLRVEKVKLLSENQQLKKQKDDVVEYIKKDWYSKNTIDINKVVIGDWRIDLLRMLGGTNEFE